MTGHYVKGSARGYHPGRIVSVCVDEQPVHTRPTRKGRVEMTFKRGYVSWTYRKRGGWSAPCSAVSDTAAGVWSAVVGSSGTRGRTVVIAPVASAALTLLQFWDLIEREGAVWVGWKGKPGMEPIPLCGKGAFEFRRLVLRGKPDIVEYSHKGHTFLWVSGCQYLDLPPAEIAAAIGHARDQPPDPGAGYEADAWSGRELCRLWLAAAVRIADWWAGLRAGAFPRTLPSAAGAFLRSRCPKRTLCTHKNPTAARLERLACHGGRASVWCYRHFAPNASGTDPKELPFPPSPYGAGYGPLYHYDYSSMYPRILAAERFPVKLLRVYDEVAVEVLRELSASFCVVASVQLSTRVCEYPCRYGGRTLYPAGRFCTVLATPDVLSALSDGAVEKVHGVAVYAVGRPYLRAASELIGLRKREHDKGNTGWELLTKLLANSMTGRMAMRSGQWVRRPELTGLYRWGEELIDSPKNGPPRRIKAMAGLVWELVKDESGPGTLTAGYAHITSYGRLMMRRLREALPPRSVVQQDTDGIWVTAEAHAAIREERIPQTLLSGLREQGCGSTATRFWTAKHYCHDGTWVTSGLSGAEFGWGTAGYTDHYTLNGATAAPTGPPRTVTRVTRKGSLNSQPLDCRVDRQGWAHPLVLPLVVGGLAPPPDPPADELF